MNFDPMYQPCASNRFCLCAARGMVATGSAPAAAAGLSILQKGGNAIDAAVATAAALTVCEPTANGLGADAFAIICCNNQLYGLNASGCSPYEISLDKLSSHQKMPVHGWAPVMVPGAVKGWGALVKRFGKLTLREDLAPAINYAENGYAAGPMLAYMWDKAARRFQQLFKGKHEFDPWFQTFTKDGKAPQFGDLVVLKDHAKTLNLIAETNTDAFYHGEIADKIEAQSIRDGGFLRKKDLEDYQIAWVDPVSINYHGYDVFELPPNGQGITALMALNILNQFHFDHRDVNSIHTAIEAMKIAFADGLHAITDPKVMKPDWHEYLKDDYGKENAKRIDPDKANIYTRETPPTSGTVYLATADKDGNMVSYIQSNYMGFGSGIVIEGTGIALQNRGADFSLSRNDANVLAPHKKSYHTIIPGFLCKDGKPLGPFGVMGGYMQPQGHVQLLTNMIDFHLNPQMALDAPRWQWTRENKILLEPGFDNAIAQQLLRKGHDIQIAAERTPFGRGQCILRRGNGVLIGATESRIDGNIACW
ncbi:MAG: gamma-glutamyltransferase family protein [Erysipelotrichaceae bacterium]|nr:gamma-glutamyltransferase family protein [Erysipelotrichaceae bacterium]